MISTDSVERQKTVLAVCLGGGISGVVVAVLLLLLQPLLLLAQIAAVHLHSADYRVALLLIGYPNSFGQEFVSHQFALGYSRGTSFDSVARLLEPDSGMVR